MKRLIICLIFIFTFAYLYADMSKDDFYVLIDEYKIHLGDDYADVIEILGEVEYVLHSYSNITLREYRYKDIVISTSNSSSDNKGNLIYGILFTSNKYTIIGGLSIGDAKDCIIAALGQPYIGYKGSVYYYNEDFDVLELKIMFDADDRVEGIQIFMGT